MKKNFKEYMRRQELTSKSETKIPLNPSLTSWERSFLIAKDAHKDQKRRGGEDYFEHPKRVSKIYWMPEFLKK